MFGIVPRAIWRHAIPPDDENCIRLETNALLLETIDGGATRRVLVECGYGDKWAAKERAIYAFEGRTAVDALREIGVSPDSIDHVIVTHLHFDHAGGLTRLDGSGSPEPVFPRADVIVQRREWEDALAGRSTMTRTYLRSHLDPIADRVRLVDGAEEVLPGIVVEPMPGHTWGQQSVRFSDDRGVVCFPGDVMPTVHHAGTAYSMAYDMLPYENMRSKLRLLSRAAEERWRLVLDHEPGNPVVCVQREGDAERTRWSLAAASL